MQVSSLSMNAACMHRMDGMVSGSIEEHGGFVIVYLQNASRSRTSGQLTDAEDFCKCVKEFQNKKTVSEYLARHSVAFNTIKFRKGLEQ